MMMCRWKLNTTLAFCSIQSAKWDDDRRVYGGITNKGGWREPKFSQQKFGSSLDRLLTPRFCIATHIWPHIIKVYNWLILWQKKTDITKGEKDVVSAEVVYSKVDLLWKCFEAQTAWEVAPVAWKGGEWVISPTFSSQYPWAAAAPRQALTQKKSI